MLAQTFEVVGRLWADYVAKTPRKLKLIDCYLAYILLTGVIQFLYCCMVGTFPFNSFLAGFISSVGSFVLAGMLPLCNETLLVVVITLCAFDCG